MAVSSSPTSTITPRVVPDLPPLTLSRTPPTARALVRARALARRPEAEGALVLVVRQHR
jgi:hypothetical protein